VTLVAAAVLGPADFAVYGLAVIVLNARGVLQLGLGQALILDGGREEAVRRRRGAAYTLVIGLSIGVSLLLALGSPWLADLFPQYDAASLALAFQITALALALAAVEQIPSSVLERSLLFTRRSIVEASTSLLYLGVGLGLLLLGYGIEGLLLARLAQGAARLLAFSAAVPAGELRPGPARRELVAPLLAAGLPLAAAGVVAFLTSNADTFAVGRLASPVEAGGYILAFTVAGFVPQFLSEALMRVTFPMFARARDDARGIATILRSSVHIVSTLMVPLTVALAVLGPDLLVAFFGAEWRPAEMPLRVLALYALLKVSADTAISMASSTHSPRIALRARVVGLATSLATVSLFYWAGAVGVAIAFTIGQACMLLVAGYVCRSLIDGSVLRVTVPSLVATALASLLAVAAAHVAPAPASLVLATLTMAVAYVVALPIVDPRIRARVAVLTR
jgi:PST family polysaccharide transporter